MHRKLGMPVNTNFRIRENSNQAKGFLVESKPKCCRSEVAELQGENISSDSSGER